MSTYERRLLSERLEALRRGVDAAEQVRDADQEYWEREACGQDSEQAEHSGYLDGFRDGLQAALDCIENGADLADRQPEAQS